MRIQEAINFVRSMNIAEETSLCFKAALVLFWGASNSCFSKDILIDVTSCSEEEVGTILKNLYDNNILLADGKLQVDWADEENGWMSFILDSLAGGGEIIRYEQVVEKQRKKKQIPLAKLQSESKVRHRIQNPVIAEVIKAPEQKPEPTKINPPVLAKPKVEKEKRINIFDGLNSIPLPIIRKTTPANDNSNDEDELIQYGGRLISKKTLGNRFNTRANIK